MLANNKTRTLSTVVGVMVSSFLVAAQLGLLVGWCNTVSAIIRHSRVDVWVMAQANPAFDYGTAIPKERLYQVRSVTGVAWAESMYMGWMFWRRPDGRMTNFELVGLDETLVGGPWSMKRETLGVVHEPDAVIVDQLYLKNLGIEDLNEEVEIADRRAVVRGISQGVRTFTAAPFVFTSLNTAIKYDLRYRPDEITYVLARAKPGVSPEQLKAGIAAELPDNLVLTSREFVKKTISYWMLETGVGITVVITALLGLIVGTMITSQALFSITSEHIPNYATLLALGFSRTYLSCVVAIQALLLGVAGIVLGSALFGRISAISQTTPIPIETTPAIFVGVLAAMISCCLLASFLSIRSIFRIDPVVIFRH